MEILKDVGSGLNEHRKNLQKLLTTVAGAEVSKIKVTHPDRLTVFGFKTLNVFFRSHGAEVIVTNEQGEEKSPRQELVGD